MSKIIVKLVDFTEYYPEIKNIRESVFVAEQQVPLDLEWDGCDDVALHVLAWVDNQPVATGRLLASGRIGRMAVLKDYRHKGVGSAVLEQLLEEARKRQFSTVYLSAQKNAINFYAKFGFKVTSEEYLDAGIPHYTMHLDNMKN